MCEGNADIVGLREGIEDIVRVGDVVGWHAVQPAHVSVNVHLVSQSFELEAHHGSQLLGKMHSSHPAQFNAKEHFVLHSSVLGSHQLLQLLSVSVSVGAVGDTITVGVVDGV